MSRRYDDRYEDRSNVSRRPPRGDRDREYEEPDIRQRYDGPPPRRGGGETIVKERESDTVISQGRRTDRGGGRQPDFLREDYGRTNAGPLVVREERIEEDDYVSRVPGRRRSMESVRSRAPPRERVEQEEIIIRERTRDNAGPPYPRSERGSFSERDQSVRERSRPPPARRDDLREEIDIRIREDESRPSRPPPPRSEVRRGDGPREVDREEITISREQRGGPPPPREIDREEITIRDSVRSPPPRERERGRGRDEEIDINIRERQRSQSRGVLVKKDHEEWVVRRRRTPSPSPSPSPPPPPPPVVEREEIIIRRRERTPSPEPLPPPREVTSEQIVIRRRERTPSPEPPPPPEPIYRPPIIQEVITHHRHIDHGIERARSPTPPPPPPSPPKEEDLEISIRRQGTRNGKSYDEEIKIDREVTERGPPQRGPVEEDRQVSFLNTSRPSRDISRHRSVGPPAGRRRYEDDSVSSEADYYNRRVVSRGYPGEAYNGATKDWGLVDIPPGTERVEMDGIGGGRQEITWDRYKGERRPQFSTGDRTYEEPWGNGRREEPPPAAPLPPPSGRGEELDIRITNTRGGAPEPSRRRDPMWTEITKDLVIREAVEEAGYQFEETDGFFYVQKYLEYVSQSPVSRALQLLPYEFR